MGESRAEGEHEEELSEDASPSAGPVAALLAASSGWAEPSERKPVKAVDQSWGFYWFEPL